MALTSPHPGSLSAALRAAGLSPPVCVQEPVVLTRVVSRTRAWVVWQVEIVLAEGAEGRWAEALRLCRATMAAEVLMNKNSSTKTTEMILISRNVS